MGNIIFTVGLVAVLVIGIGVFAFIQARKQMEIQKENPGHPQGYWMGQGIAIGIAIGAGVGVALGNIAIGVGIGVAIGVAIGSGMENRHKDELRPITEEEEKLRKQTLMVTMGILIAGFIILAAFMFLR